MREIRTSGSMSGDGKRDDVGVATAPILDSTEKKGNMDLGKTEGSRKLAVGSKRSAKGGDESNLKSKIQNCPSPRPPAPSLGLIADS
jgi:hypothetical protein